MTRDIFISRNHAENDADRLVPDLFLRNKSFVWGKNKWSAAL